MVASGTIKEAELICFLKEARNNDAVRRSGGWLVPAPLKAAISFQTSDSAAPAASQELGKAVEQSYKAAPSGRLKDILGIENSHADWPVDNTGISMDPPGSGLGGPRGGSGHLLGVRGDSAATVVPRCEVEVAVNAALQVKVSSLQVEIAALRASLQMESVAHREDVTSLFEGLLSLVLSQECSMEARVLAVDSFFDNTLRGSLGINVHADAGTATGIIKVLTTQPAHIYRRNNLDSVTGATFSGCYFFQYAPPSDGWWRIGPDKWLFSGPGKCSWWIGKVTDEELYEANLKWAFACTNLKSYYSLRDHQLPGPDQRGQPLPRG